MIRLGPMQLLATDPDFVHMGSRFRDGGTGGSGALTLLLILAVTLIAGWAISHLTRYCQRQLHRSPKRLFAELCQAHQLTRAQRAALVRLARRHRLPQPCAFLAPQWLSDAARGSQPPGERPLLDQLAEQLFGGLDSSPTTRDAQ